MRRLIDLWWAERNTPEKAEALAPDLEAAERAVDAAFQEFDVATSPFRRLGKPGTGLR